MNVNKMLRVIMSVLVLWVTCPVPVFSNPTGEQVVSGDATFDRSMPDTLNITTPSDRLIVNYDSFGIAANETVRFMQPSSSAVALNRVIGADPSAIYGQLTANGRIFLINPNGVLFGAGSRVDAAGLVASTLNITNADFLAGNYQFAGQGGAVANYGTLSAPGGYAALLGSTVENAGIIEATLGSVILASGEQVTLGLDPMSIISVAVETATTQNPAGKDSAVKNTGTIAADGGKVILTAQTLNSIFNNAVNNTGIIEANSLDAKSGLVRIDANQRVNVGGLINADGGKVEVNSQGADFNGIINAALGEYFMNGGDTFVSGGYIGDQTWNDELNIIVNGNLIIDGNMTFNADSNHNGSGFFRQNAGTTIVGSKNVTINGGEDLTLGDIYFKGSTFTANTTNGSINVYGRISSSLLNILTETVTVTVPWSTTLTPPIDDVYVAEKFPTTNYGSGGSGNSLKVSLESGSNPKEERILLKFNLSSISDSVTINDADLILKLSTSATNGAQLDLYHSNTDSWSESTVTWNTRPLTSGSILDSVTTSSGDVTETWDGSSLASAIQADLVGDNYSTLVIKSPSNGKNTTFYSSEASGGGAQAPQLALTGTISQSQTNVTGYNITGDNNGTINLTAKNNVQFTDAGQLKTLGTVNVTATQGSVSNNNTNLSATNIIAQNLALSAKTGIGSSAAINTQVSKLAAKNTTSGNINISNTGALTIGTVGSLSGVTNSGGSVNIATASPLTVSNDVTASGAITLVAGNTGASNDNLTLNADIKSTGGGLITLNAGDNYIQNSNADVSTSNQIDIYAGNDAILNGSADIDAAYVNVTTGRDFLMNDTSDIGDAGGTYQAWISSGRDIRVSNNSIYADYVYAIASQDISLGKIYGDNYMYLNAGRNITDNNGSDINLTGNNLQMYAGGSIGSSSSFIETNVSNIWAYAYGGGVYLSEANGVNLQDIQALGSTIDIVTGGTTYAYNLYALGHNSHDPAVVNLDVTHGDLYVDGNIQAIQCNSGDATVNLDADRGSIYVGFDGDPLVLAQVNGYGTAKVDMDAHNDVNVTNGSWVQAITGTSDFTALVDIDAGDDININNGNLLARVNSYGHAEVNLDAGDDININNWSTVIAETGFEFGPPQSTAEVDLSAGDDINLDYSSSTQAISHDSTPAKITMDAGDDINGYGTISATSDYGYALIKMLAGYDIFAANVTATGALSSNLEGIFNEFLALYGDCFSAEYPHTSAIFMKSDKGNIYLGDITADMVLLAAMGDSGKCHFSEGGNIYMLNGGESPELFTTFELNDGFNPDLVTADYLGMIAAHNIGENPNDEGNGPIRTDVNVVSAYSWKSGDIYIANKGYTEIPIFAEEETPGDELFTLRTLKGPEIIGWEKVNKPLQVGLYLPEQVGVSVAANNGIAHITTYGDMIVNSIVTPRGGVYLGTEEGSIYAGQGWCPDGSGCGSRDDDWGWWGHDWWQNNDSIIPMDGWSEFSLGDNQGADHFTPIVNLKVEENKYKGYGYGGCGEGGCDEQQPVDLSGPNVLAGGFSYFSAPKGTIGVGTLTNEGTASSPEWVTDPNVINPLKVCIQAFQELIETLEVAMFPSAVPEGFTPVAGLTLEIGGAQGSYTGPNGTLGISGDIEGIVRPGTTAVTGVFPSPALDFSNGVVPPGYVFYNDTEGNCCPALLGPGPSNRGPEQIWPPLPQGGIFNLASQLLTRRWVYPVPEILRGRLTNPLDMLSSADLGGKGSVFFYQPLTEMDMAAFGSMEVGEGGYQFEGGSINMAGHEGLLPLLDNIKNKNKKKGTQ